MKLVYAALLLAIAAPAGASSLCYPRETLTKILKRDYGESREAMGLVADHSVMEIWRSEGTGSWSVVVTNPDGKSCIIATGDAWTPMLEDAEGEPT